MGKIFETGKYVFYRGEEKQRRKRKNMFGEGKLLTGRRRWRRGRKIPGIGRYMIRPTII